MVEAEFQTASLKLVGLAPAGFTPVPLHLDDSDTQDVWPNALCSLRGQVRQQDSRLGGKDGPWHLGPTGLLFGVLC